MTCIDGQVTSANCTFTCVPGYELSGPSIIFCLPNSTWSNPQPHCTLSHCQPFDPLPNSYQNGLTDCPTVFGSECETHCVYGYRQMGEDSLQTCMWNDTTKDVRWSESGIDCESKDLMHDTSLKYCYCYHYFH